MYHEEMKTVIEFIFLSFFLSNGKIISELICREQGNMELIFAIEFVCRENCCPHPLLIKM